VNAHIEGTIFKGQFHGVVKCAAGGHQGSRCEDATSMGFDDAFVHILCESEIVGVNRQPSQNNFN
jgi:hypothetical protein